MVAILAAVFGYGAPAAHAQLVAPQFENFDNPVGGFELAGWTRDVASTEGVQWNCDATPALIIAGGDSSAFSSPNSLNFNDGVDYDDTTDGALTQSVTSPDIDISGVGATNRLGFMIAMNSDATFDLLTVELENAVTGVPFVTFTIGAPGSVGATITLGSNRWTGIGISGPSAGLTTIRVRFTFDSDDSLDAFPGCFLDNFYVICADVLPPSIPVQVSPIGGATVATPFVLDWSPGSTDSGTCGAGQVHRYIAEVDDDPLFGSINLQFITGNTTATVTALGPGTWNWRVRALDQLGNSTTSAVETFFIEPEIAPDAPTSLFVNESINGAQTGNGGFVQPVLDLTPAFSALYTDSNTVANAIALRFQVSTDPTFTTILSDSGPVGISPVLPKGSRCPDLTISVLLQRNTVYYWRIAFEDGSITLPPDVASGLTGPFSVPQSFRTGDDFEFGVRHGSTHHGHRCWVATAAYGSADASPVQALQAWRFGTMESSAAGRVVSRAYHVIGAEASSLTVRSNSVAGAILPFAAMLGGSGSLVALCALAVLALLGMSRVVARM